ncbi:MAG: S41 family peptidase [bacterium]|nr:S41 family peptidase [bacterium]
MQKLRCIPFGAVQVAFAILISLGTVSNVNANPGTVERLYYTAKVWGYLKYFHPAVNGYRKNLDSILVALIPEIEAATDDASFNISLNKMLAYAGPMPSETTPRVVFPDSEIIDLNIDDWHHDSMLSSTARAFLDSVRVNFRFAENSYYQTGVGGQGELDYDSTLSLQEPYRLLTLFRAWNIYNYFSPYKKVLDRPWDSTLAEIIPYVQSATTPLAFHLALRRLQSRQQDAHASSTSSALAAQFGPNGLRMQFSMVEGQTVVSRVFDGVIGVKQGDILLSIDGTPTQSIRDSLRPYTTGGSQPIVERNINRALLFGPETIATLALDDGTGARTVIVPRNGDSTEFRDSLVHWRGDGAVYKMLPENIGYINYGILLISDVPKIVDSLWNTKAIIFDVRNYPLDHVLYMLAQSLLESSVPFVQFRQPSTVHPGTVSYFYYTCGPESINANRYRGKVIVLVNENTQSAAEFATMALQAGPNVVVVGSQTAGADGNVMFANYPSGIRMKYTGLGVYYPDGSPTQRVGIKIDVPAEPTIAGIRAGRDEVLEKALSIAAATSVHTVRSESSLELFPNPTSGMTTIHGLPQNATDLTVTNILGQVILKISKPIPSMLDLSRLAVGSYFVRIASPNAVVTKMIVRE